MSLLKKLFGGGKDDTPEPEMYNGFLIFPEPIKESGGYRISARIEKEINGALRTHILIRADTYSAQETALEASLSKAKQAIDQMGDRIFGQG